jgi:hypothetical protein
VTKRIRLTTGLSREALGSVPLTPPAEAALARAAQTPARKSIQTKGRRFMGCASLDPASETGPEHRMNYAAAAPPELCTHVVGEFLSTIHKTNAEPFQYVAWFRYAIGFDRLGRCSSLRA